MQTRLDQALLRILQDVPDWGTVLAQADAHLLQRRLEGATLSQLATDSHLTVPGVRFRLYGAGHGGVRRGGVLGCLRTRGRRSSAGA